MKAQRMCVFSPHVITFAQKKILAREQSGADVAKPTVAAATLQAVFVPEHIQCPQKVAVLNQFITFGTVMRPFVG